MLSENYSVQDLSLSYLSLKTIFLNVTILVSPHAQLSIGFCTYWTKGRTNVSGMITSWLLWLSKAHPISLLDQKKKTQRRHKGWWLQGLSLTATANSFHKSGHKELRFKHLHEFISHTPLPWIDFSDLIMPLHFLHILAQSWSPSLCEKCESMMSV